jgi:hypothetical protein
MTVDYNALDEEHDNELLAMLNAEQEEPEPAEEPKPTPEPEPAPIAETLTPQVPESQYKEAVRAMNRAQEELAHRRKDDTNRDAIIQQLQNRIQELESKPDTQAVEDDLKEGKEFYPEVVNPLLKRISELEAKLTNVSKDVGDVKSTADSWQQKEVQRHENEYWGAIKAAHNDVGDIASSQDYADWYDQQAPMIQQALTSNNARDVIAGINLYKSSLAQTPAPSASNQKQDKLQAAREAAAPSIKAAPRTEQKKTFTHAQIAKMSPTEYAKYEDEIDEALARGEVF